MKIKHLRIENFRAIASFDEDLGSYTTFIGYNGGGKSSILHAVRWFFENFELTGTDVFSEEIDEPDLATLPDVKVTVTFDQLTEIDRENFGPYAMGEKIVLTRVGGAGKTSKLYGERLVCPSFQDIRKEKTVSAQRKLAQDLITSNEIFSNLNITNKSSKQEINEILNNWEADPNNHKYLVPINDEDANHFFGAVGSDKLKIDSGFVFIPAAPDLTGQFDVLGKGSALQLLLGDILKGVVSKSINEWTERNQLVLDELETTVSEVAATRLSERAGLVNHHLEQYLPGVEIEFKVGLQDWVPKANPIAQSRMQRGDRNFIIESEGHGVQRATLLALLQATADSRVEPEPTGGNDHENKQNQHGDQRSSLIVFVEEPEVYQHPVQARMMARSFTNAARTGNVQFVLATHSPYFLDPNEIHNTFRVENYPTGSKVNRPSVDGALRAKNANGELDKFFLESVIESLFSRAALVVEGDTERAIFDTVHCSDDGLTLRDLGISVAVAAGSKSLLDMAQLIHDFGVPIFVLRDGDSDSSIALKTAQNKSQHEVRKKFKCTPDFENEEHLKIATDKRDSLLNSWESGVNSFIEMARKAGFGEGLDDFKWGGGTQIGRYVGILNHDLESELHNWPSFITASRNIGLPPDLRQAKKAGILARVAARSKREDMPTGLKRILEAVRLSVDHT
ncbi:AAA family ATPase [Corynebacterium sp. P7003]|uniref:AAA family ATPase n=1 Tax=Corynebacterium pygosceleis TaxID=2800406 RepID=A0ABT3WVT8_9CORY|nr:AAA family ATPase [Corynebacterium pygosceleis]MCX7444907.1 AAA family ATPase [Corynebacterium pygosceleis]